MNSNKVKVVSFAKLCFARKKIGPHIYTAGLFRVLSQLCTSNWSCQNNLSSISANASFAWKHHVTANEVL